VTAVDVRPASGKLGVLTPGMGAVATTFYAGVLAVRRGLAKPFGSLTQLGHIRLGKRTEHRNPLIKDFVSLASLDDLVFGGWDPIPDDAYSAALRAGVLTPQDLEGVREELSAIKPMSAVFSHDWVKLLTGTTNVKTGRSFSKSISPAAGARTWSWSRTETSCATRGNWPPNARRSPATSTVSNSPVSRLITSIFLGEYRRISSGVTLTRSPGCPGAISTG